MQTIREAEPFPERLAKPFGSQGFFWPVEGGDPACGRKDTSDIGNVMVTMFRLTPPITSP
jgi:hypothetical protein